jgi:trehalose 6-phosphate phosphatase
VLAAAAALPGARIVTGKKVCNVLPRDAPDKGAALEVARVALACDAAIYVGDDDTDEDVFRLRPAWPLLTVRVGARRPSRAAFHLRRQRLLDDLLEVLVRLRLGPERVKARP